MAGATKLSALDASFLHLETPSTHMHIGGVAVFEPSPLGKGADLYRGLIAAIEPRLDLIPRYRQKLAYVPLSLDTPVWVDDPEFDIHNHVLRSHLPAPGGDKQLQNLIARTFSRQLDRRRPLWEVTIIEGLPAGRWALLTKTHHSLVDGISALELVTLLFDVDPNPTPMMGVSSWIARDAPSALDLLMDSVRERLSRPRRLLSTARGVAENPLQLAGALRDAASGLAVMAQRVRPGGVRSPINGANGPARGYQLQRFPLEDFRTVKNALGGTINDVVLAVVTGGLRQFLLARGHDPESEHLKALCPVSLRDAGAQTALGNKLAMLIVDLPIHVDEPVQRMAEMRAELDHLKARKQAVGADVLLNLAGFAPPTLHAMVARQSLKQLGFNLLVTNVPGPQFPLYCQGARLLEAFPVAFLYEGQQVAVAIFSYCGTLNFGFIADAGGMPDLDVLVDGCRDAMAELVAAAEASAAAHARQAAPPPRPRRRASTLGAAATTKSATRLKRSATTRVAPKKPAGAKARKAS
ncbi:MAG: wax ester/triacylglycerol synthase family O-acyltransferase [Candidatus Dormibacteria bacterium]